MSSLPFEKDRSGREVVPAYDTVFGFLLLELIPGTTSPCEEELYGHDQVQRFCGLVGRPHQRRRRIYKFFSQWTKPTLPSRPTPDSVVVVVGT
jgi:hypothetical protein